MYQHRDEVDRAFAQPGVGNIEGAPRGIHHLLLQPLPLGRVCIADERELDVGEARDHGLAIELQQLVLAALLQLQLALQAAAVEDRLRQAGGDRIEGRIPAGTGSAAPCW